MYGEKRLHALIRGLPDDGRAITDGIARDALDFQDGNANDDIAIVTFAPCR